jgi:hypothetical protein
MRRFVVALLIGGLVGIGIGLFLGWGPFPVITVDNQMRALSQLDKDRYTVMVAKAYEADLDVNEAISRLRPLGVENIPAYVRDVTERKISESGTGNQAEIRYLVSLSRVLGYFTPPMQPFAVAPTPTPQS